MRESLAKIRANVEHVTYQPEKERWEANIALWQATIDQSQNVTMMSGFLDVIKANVGKITEATELDRWQANRDLWAGVLGKR